MTTIGAHLRSAWLRALQVELSSSFRHDLRNKLGSIRNAVHYLRKRTEGQAPWNDSRVPRMFELVDHELKAAGDLVSPPPRPDLPPCHVGEVVGGLARRLGSSVQVEVEGEAGGLLLACPADDFELVLCCLIDNAIEGATNGTPGAGPAGLGLRAEAGQLVVEVTDGGPGLDPEQLTEVRRPFFSTKVGHLGLGLNVATRILGAVGGTLDLVPGERGGLQARLIVPVAQPALEVVPRALIIDDDEAIRLTLGALLEDGGMKVSEAATLAAGALALAAGRFDLVVIDWQLPDGSGRELLPLIDGENIPVVAVMSGARLEPAPPRVNLVLEKGDDPEQLVHRLLSAVKARAEDEHGR